MSDLIIDGSLTANEGLSVTSGGATITGETTSTGKITGDAGLTISSGGATITGGATFSGTTAITHNGNTIVNTSSKIPIARLPYQSTLSNSSSYVPLSSAVYSSLIGTTSKATNGYHKFYDGLIIQWGILDPDTTGDTTVTLPTSFSTTYYGVTRSYYETTSATSITYRSMSITSKSTSNFTMYVTSGAYSSIWVAIGY